MVSADDAEVARGKQLFVICQACHSVTPDTGAKVGPSLFGVYKREAATLEDFDFSQALRDQDLKWTEKNLDQWIKQPSSMVPGTIMSFAGIQDDQSRKAIIEYLKTLR